MSERNLPEQEFSFKSLFCRLTNKKSLIFLIILGCITYFNSLFGELIGDDFLQIVNNQYIHSLNGLILPFISPLNNVVNAFRYYRPLVYVFYTLIYSFSGQTTFFYHLLQVCLHIFNAFIIFLLFNTAFKKRLSLLLAIIFLVHPINQEAVSYISALQDILYLSFGILALFMFQSGHKLTAKRTYIISLLIVLSLMSKETGILFIPLIILCGYLFKDKKIFKSSIFISIASLLGYAFLRFVIARNNLPEYTAITHNILTTGLMTLPKMIFYYLKTFLFPRELSMTQLWLVNSISVKDYYMPLAFDIIAAILIIGLGAFIYNRKKDQFPIYIFFLAWFTLGIIPHLQIWALDMTVADRWFYFPFIGLLGLIGITLSNIVIKRKAIRWAFGLLILVTIVALSLRTIVRNANFQTTLGLLKHDAPISNNYTMYKLLIEEYLKKEDFQSAKMVLPKLTSLDSNNAINLWYAGLIDENLGNYLQAEEYFKKFSVKNEDLLVYIKLSRIYIFNKKYLNSEDILKQEIVKYPNNPTLWELFAVTEYKLQKREIALNAAGRARELLPNQETESLYNMIFNNQTFDLN